MKTWEHLTKILDAANAIPVKMVPQGSEALHSGLSETDTCSVGKSEVSKVQGTEWINKSRFRKAILDLQDPYGNTLLHIAARNENPKIYDHLIELGADPSIRNFDGLTPFLTTARFGIWSMFNHIWDRQMTLTLWRFGNVERAVTSMSEVDWRGPEAFSKQTHIDHCLVMLTKQMKDFLGKMENDRMLNRLLKNIASISPEDSLYNLKRKLLAVTTKLKEQGSDQHLNLLIKKFQASTPDTQEKDQSSEEVNKVCLLCCNVDVEACNCVPREAYRNGDKGTSNTDINWDDGLGEALVAIRIITVFRPRDWYDKTKEKIESAVLKKWAQGFHLIHIGQTIIPYIIILVLFVIMWWKRQLNVLVHNFWWADQAAVQHVRNSTIKKMLANPVYANVSELQSSLKSWAYGTAPSQLGLLSEDALGVESTCGWKSIVHSHSGALQAALIIYAVPSLFRLAFVQRRIRPSDLDENEDMKISVDEIINFIYFNLESVLHVVIAALFVTMGAARVSAGDQCDTYHVHMEKNATAIAAMFLFLNLFVIFKPYKGIGLLVLTIYRFLLSDVFNFLLMYSVFFLAFLLALQTLHNANHVYLAWMDITSDIVPQVCHAEAMSLSVLIPYHYSHILKTYFNYLALP